MTDDTITEPLSAMSPDVKKAMDTFVERHGRNGQAHAVSPVSPGQEQDTSGTDEGPAPVSVRPVLVTYVVQAPRLIPQFRSIVIAMDRPPHMASHIEQLASHLRESELARMRGDLTMAGATVDQRVQAERELSQVSVALVSWQGLDG